MKNVPEDALDFETFQRNNRYKVNYSLNRVLWFSVLTGPALALGILTGVFKNINYMSCIAISVIMLLVAGINLLILKRNPYSHVPGVLALIGVDFLLLYMTLSHVSIRLTWFMVPTLSLLLCNTRIYVYTSIFNYLIMGLATWLESSHYVEIRADFNSAFGAFINIFAGCTIEAVLMFFAGYVLSMASVSYFHKMMGQYEEAHAQQEQLTEQLEILGAMADIYDYVNLIDFSERTEMSLRSEKLQKLTIEEGQDHTHLVQSLKDKIDVNMLDEFWNFTNITTVPQRLIGRNSISGEFVGNNIGWFRAQYIRIQGDIDKEPDLVIYTIQSIDADKRREEKLIQISRTDELTRLFNRRCYEEDMEQIRDKGISDDLVLLSADLNGLKNTNDNKGHAAGDELIRGAAKCLKQGVGESGKVYRTGGDEFICIIHTDDIEKITNDIRDIAINWKGRYIDSISISLGYAIAKDHPDATIEELEKLADDAMYKEKEKYYQQPGHDRRTR